MKFLARAALGLLLLLITLGALFFGFRQYQSIMASKPEPFERKARERVWQVETLTAERKNVPIELSAFGTVQTGQTLTLRSETRGEIEFLSPALQEGNFVAEGQLLLGLDPFDQEQALAESKLAVKTAERDIELLLLEIENERATIEERQQEMQAAENDLARQQKLVDQKISPRAALERAEVTLANISRAIAGTKRSVNVLSTKRAQQENQLERAKLTLARAQRDLEGTKIFAPFSGLVSSVDLALGKLINANEVLMTLTPLDKMQVAFSLSNLDIGLMIDQENSQLIGRDVEIDWTLGTKTLTYKGEISRIGANIDVARGGLRLVASLKDLPQDTPLRPGAFVDITVDGGEANQVFLLPQSAISAAGELYFVDQDKRAAVVKIEPLRPQGEDLIVQGEIPDGALIVVNRFPQLSAGVKLKLAPKRQAETSVSEQPKQAFRLPADQNGQAQENQQQGTKQGQGVRQRGGAGGGARSSGARSAGSAGGDLVTLTPETQAILIERFKPIPIPAERKKQIMTGIESGQMPRTRLQRMADRMGLDLPELQSDQ